ncbi:hypothetical protein [Catellatospora coxensis]|uniref:Uncharacterized protein n=1 Tax=Catellatospora coxensis TaxID=310354 RepID=A0A8J3P4E1_9ACTN|nr:hypothetical protein [Catellatospora coxensis]GIG03738.1 hypothetical protein Cco03nite_04380 [Catellatospora coxensis]
MGHVLARVAGYGMVLTPYWPYKFERSDAAPDAVVVTNRGAAGPAKALLDPADAHSVPGVVDVEPGPDHPFWVIETSAFIAAWPAGFSVESTSEPYCLAGEHDASISVQGPVRIADPDVMITPGQTVVARRTMGPDVQVIELAYEHDGEPWWQGVYLYPRKDGRVLVVTAQSREPGIATARRGVEWMLALT